MKQVKMFTSTNLNVLEKDINDWLKENKNDISLSNIKMSDCEGTKGASGAVVLISYDALKNIEVSRKSGITGATLE